MDCGVRIAERAWPLRSPNSVAERDLRLTNVRETLVFAWRKNDIASAAPSFDEVDRSDPKKGAVENVFQLVIRALEVCEQLLRDKNTTGLECDKAALQCYLEVVLARPAAERPPGPVDYNLEQKRLAAEYMEKIYGPDRVTATHLMAGARSKQGSAMFGSASTDDIAFMQGYDDRDVLEYRFWIFSYEESIRVADSIVKVLQDSFEFYRHAFGAGGMQLDERGKYVHKRGPQPQSMTDIVKDHECYRLLTSNEVYLEAIYQYTRDDRLRDREVVQEAMSAAHPIAVHRNPINPYRIFSAESYFARASDSQMIDRRQCNIDNYYKAGANNARYWTFPRTNLVLVVPSVLWSPRRMRQMYTPDHQKLTIEPRLDRGIVPAPRRPPAPPPRPAQNEDDDGDAGAANIAVDSDSDESLHLSEDGPIDEAAAPAAQPGRAAARAGFELYEIDEDENEDLHSDDESQAEEEEEVPDGTDVPDRRDLVVGPQPLRAPGAALPSVSRYDSETTDTDHLIVHGMVKQRREEGFTQFEANGGRNKTQIDALRQMYLNTTCWHVESMTDPVERAREYVSMQFRAIEEYMAKCMQPCSNVSGPGRAINKWMHDAAKGPFGLRFTSTERPFFDRDLSLFGTQVVREFDNYEQLVFVHTAHSEMFMARQCAMSSYWYQYNQLRLHLMLHGAQSTSKSHPIARTALLMIEGTAVSLTSQSDQADSVDNDEDDMVFVFEEMPVDMISMHTKNQKTLDSLKEMLTRGICTRKVQMRPDDDGKRWSRVVTSSKQVSYLCACNLVAELFDKAIRSRFVMRHHVVRERPDFTMQEKESDETNKSREPGMKMRIAKFTHDYRLGQALHYHTEKLISIGALLSPSAIAFTLIYPNYKTLLKDRHAIKIERRMEQQLRVFMRKLIIEHAWYWLYHSVKSPHYGARAFSPWHLLAINPMLKDSEEMVYFAIDYFKESFIDPNQQVLVNCLRRYIVPDLMNEKSPISYFRTDAGEAIEKKKFQNISTQKLVSGFQQSLDALVASGASALHLGEWGQEDLPGRQQQQAPVDQDWVDMVSGALPAAAAASTQPRNPTPPPAPEKTLSAMAAAKPAPVETYDYNYFGIRMSLKKLVEVITANMVKHEMPRQLLADETERVLVHLTTCKLASRRYKASPKNMGAPVVIDETDQHEHAYTPVRIGADGKRVFVHSSLLFGEDGDPHEMAIEACHTVYTPHAKFLRGVPVDESHPHVLAVRIVAPTKYMPMTTPLPPIGDEPPPKPQDKAMLNISYNDYATRYRLQQLAMPVRALDVAKYEPVLSDRDARKDAKMVQKELIEYPKTLLDRADNARRHAKEIAHLASRVGYSQAMAKKREFAGTERAFEDLTYGADDDLEAQARNEEERELARAYKRLRRAGQEAPGNAPPPPAPAPQPTPAPQRPMRGSAANIIFNEESNGPGLSGAEAAASMRVGFMGSLVFLDQDTLQQRLRPMQEEMWAD